MAPHYGDDVLPWYTVCSSVGVGCWGWSVKRERRRYAVTSLINVSPLSFVCPLIREIKSCVSDNTKRLLCSSFSSLSVSLLLPFYVVFHPLRLVVCFGAGESTFALSLEQKDSSQVKSCLHLKIAHRHPTWQQYEGATGQL